MGKKSFTLVEMLVVIAIITILAGMLLPALNKAREKAHVIVCCNVLKNLGMNLEFYSEDSDGFLPPLTQGGTNTWHYAIAPY